MYSEEKHNIEKISLARDDIDFDIQDDNCPVSLRTQ